MFPYRPEEYVQLDDEATPEQVELPKYTIRVKWPETSDQNGDPLAFSVPKVMLVDRDGKEVGSLRGVNHVAVIMEHEQFTDVEVTFALFEVEGLSTMVRGSDVES